MLLHAADAATLVAIHAVALAMAAAEVILAVAIPVADAVWVAFDESCLDSVACSLAAEVVEVVDQAAVAIWAAVVNQVAIQVVIQVAVAILVATPAVTPVAGQDASTILTS